MKTRTEDKMRNLMAFAFIAFAVMFAALTFRPENVSAAAKLSTKKVTVAVGKKATVKVTSGTPVMTYFGLDCATAQTNSRKKTVTVTGRTAGSTTMTTRMKDGKKLNFKVVVVDMQKQADIRIGERLKLSVLGVSAKNVSWSAASKIVTVKNGVVTARRPGKTYVTAKIKGTNVSLKCKVTVEDVTEDYVSPYEAGEYVIAANRGDDAAFNIGYAEVINCNVDGDSENGISVSCKPYDGKTVICIDAKKRGTYDIVVTFDGGQKALYRVEVF